MVEELKCRNKICLKIQIIERLVMRHYLRGNSEIAHRPQLFRKRTLKSLSLMLFKNKFKQLVQILSSFVEN